MNMNEPPSLLRNDYAGGEPLADDAARGHAVEPLGDRRDRRRHRRRPQQARAVLSQSSYYSHDDLRLHFGLGDSTTADRVEVRWPAGAVQTLSNVRAIASSTITEGAIATISSTVDPRAYRGLRIYPRHVCLTT